MFYFENPPLQIGRHQPVTLFDTTKMSAVLLHVIRSSMEHCQPWLELKSCMQHLLFLSSPNLPLPSVLLIILEYVMLCCSPRKPPLTPSVLLQGSLNAIGKPEQNVKLMQETDLRCAIKGGWCETSETGKKTRFVICIHFFKYKDRQRERIIANRFLF